jgi:hypothetical protein
VNVSEEVETVPSAVLLLLTGIVTLADGFVPSTTVNVAFPPASVVNNPVVGVTMIRATSMSMFVNVTSAGLSPL